MVSRATSVLVTGGAGFIGCELVSRLVERACDVGVLDSLHPDVHPERSRPTRLHDRAALLVVDVRDASAVHRVVAEVRPDVVVHLAAETATGTSLLQPVRHASVNVGGTAQLIEALAVHPPAHVVIVSSRAVYGEGLWCDDAGVVGVARHRRTIDLAAHRFDPFLDGRAGAASVPHDAAVTPTNPVSVYGATKLAQEHLFLAWGAALGIPVSVLRPQNVYGFGQAASTATGVIGWFVRCALRHEPIEVFEDGAIVRDVVHVRDVASAILAAIDRPPEVSRVIDIGSGRGERLIDIAEAIAAAADAPIPVVTGAFRLGDVRAASCDPLRAEVEIGFRAQERFDDALSELIDGVAASLVAAG